MSAHPAPRTTGCPFHAFSARTRAGGAAGAAALAYGLVAYAAFFFWFLYAIGWLGNWIVPRTIDSGVPGDPGPSIIINLGLVLLFALQHTVMARPAFKRWFVRIIPATIERSTFVLLASAAMWLLVLAWRPIPAAVWSLTHPAAVWGLSILSLAGWLIVLLSSFVINHFDLFGLRQVWSRFSGRPLRPIGFRLAGPYRLVRHPLMLGFLIAFWATPHMSVGRLVFALAFTAYIAVGIAFEERDLIAEHGDDYRRYRRDVRAVLPLPRLR